MSTMKFNRKPPLAKSPIRLRSRRALHSNSASLQTPPGSLMKSAKLSRGLATDVDVGGTELRPEYRFMSSELRALAKQVRDELGNGDLAAKPKSVGGSLSANSSPLFFERGKLYDEYAARRNERLRKKKICGAAYDFAKTPSYRLGVTVESSKRRDSTRKMESLRKSVASAYGGGQRLVGGETPRYLLRSMCKDSKKPPPAPLAMNFERSALPSERNIGVRRSVRRV
ncbi:unnamed protein product [Linum tenue]|uniref:Uncharacterized protein n=1 Tax=Linum tenue TaxID=586396 RepID=A0AAV0HAD5_9ROSI|nr:unnamed protein product [Linum tenue]